jgi:hypothetical protein
MCHSLISILLALHYLFVTLNLLFPVFETEISLLLVPCLSVYARNYSTDSSVIPVKKYANADIQKYQILKENKGKAGVYR